jgi:hypothetical protein
MTTFTFECHIEVCIIRGAQLDASVQNTSRIVTDVEVKFKITLVNK